MKYLALLLFSTLLTFKEASSQMQYRDLYSNLAYYENTPADMDTTLCFRCRLDLYLPPDTTGFATIIWFHGGGLTQGNKEIPSTLKNRGIAVVGAGYRLNPAVKAPLYIQDAAAAVAWVFRHIAEFGGDPELIFLSGHSAGGYLASMVGLDLMWLERFSVDGNRIAGLIPLSGHTITHFTARAERGIPGERAVVDSLAPLYHVRADAPPMLLITGDRELEMLGRYEENAYLMRMMRVSGHTANSLLELQGYGHNMVDPALPILLREVQRLTRLKKTNKSM